MSQPKGADDKPGPNKHSQDAHSSYERTPGPGLTVPHPGKSGNVLETMLDQIEEGVCAVDEKGLVAYINLSMCGMIRRNRADVLGKNSYSSFAEAGYLGWDVEDSAILAGGKETVKIERVTTSSRKDFFAKIRKMRVNDEGKSYAVTIVRYVTGETS